MTEYRTKPTAWFWLFTFPKTTILYLKQNIKWKEFIHWETTKLNVSPSGIRHQSIHPFTKAASVCSKVAEGLQSIPPVIRWGMRRTLEKLPVHHRTTQGKTRDTVAQCQILPVNLESAINPTSVSLACSRKVTLLQKTRKKMSPTFTSFLQ